MVVKTVEMDFEYMNTITHPPVTTQQLYQNACSADGVTINSWEKVWVENMTANHKKYGPFSKRSIGKLHGKFARQPAICQGSGPSLKNNIHWHRSSYTKKNPLGIEKVIPMEIPIVSCLHNYHYNEDNGVIPNYYVSLDAGEITLDEVSKGGKKSAKEYLDSTKDKTLLAYVGSSPRLLEAWKGEILFFNCPIPNEKVTKAFNDVEPFHTYVSTGGNVLGACVYIAKGILGCNPIAFTGADFSFSYTKKFHSWEDDTYGKVGRAIRAVDVYGNKVLTWQSYHNFKSFFDWLSQAVPGHYVNCTEGGCLGAYHEGNLASVAPMDLEYFIRQYTLFYDVKDQCERPNEENKLILY